MKSEDYQNILRHDFSSFIRFAFAELHPHAAYQHNWHIDVMAHYLTLAAKGECNRLIINMPPRMLKSHCASIALPAWVLGRDPRKRLLYLHGSKALGLELEDACADLMRSRRYRALFPSTIIKEEKGRFRTSFNGHRQFMPIMGKLTGLGADIIVIDDPASTDEVHNPGARKRLHQQFDENILQRLDDKKSGAIILVMQRLHEGDLTAHLLAKNEGWVYVNLSAVALQDKAWALPGGHTYQCKKGEALHPEREPQEQLLEILHSIGGYAFAYQYLQGEYKPRFGECGHGCIFLTPYREGEFYDERTSPERPFGFYRFDEKALIRPKVFGIGTDPCPPDMRESPTQEELEISLAIHRETVLEHQRKVASGELEY